MPINIGHPDRVSSDVDVGQVEESEPEHVDSGKGLNDASGPYHRDLASADLELIPVISRGSVTMCSIRELDTYKIKIQHLLS